MGNKYILDAVAILNEIIEEAKKRNLRRVFFKIDFVKAYNTVNWGFVEEMMEFFNLDRKWICWIMVYITSTHALILVNGSPTKEFKLERELRQGDPLSPFLYLLVVERGAKLTSLKGSGVGSIYVS